jgi:hypothetical protein
MRGAIPPLPKYAFMACCLARHRDNFTITFNRARNSSNMGTMINMAILHIIIIIIIIIIFPVFYIIKIKILIDNGRSN